MAEAIIRQHKRRTDRWMPRKKRVFPVDKVKAAAFFALRGTPGFLLAFADMVGIPSVLPGALGLAMAVLGLDVKPLLAGSAASILVRLVSGLPPRWELLLTAGVVAVCARLIKGQGTLLLMLSAAVAALPTAVSVGV